MYHIITGALETVAVTLGRDWILFLDVSEADSVMRVAVGDGAGGGGLRITGDEERLSLPLRHCCSIPSPSRRFIIRMQGLLAAVLISPIFYR